MIETTAERSISISGEVEGDVTVATGYTVVIAHDATIHGNVRVAAGSTAVIEGEVQGDVIAEGDVKLGHSATVHGSIEGHT